MCHSTSLTAIRERILTVDLVSDPPTQLSMPDRGAETSLERMASVMLNPLDDHLHQISDTSLFNDRLKTELSESIHRQFL